MPALLTTIDTSGASSAAAATESSSVTVAALVVHIMTNTALTGATYDIDGGHFVG
jgi:hypothetical protein